MFVHRTIRFLGHPMWLQMNLLSSTNRSGPEKPKVAAVIPAFNESGRVGRVIVAIPRDLVDDIVVVNDHSTDGTVMESVKNGATHVTASRSHGVGAAIKTGYREALMRGADVLLVLAGDDQHDPCEISKILKPVLEGEADYVVGDRLSACTRGNGMSPVRFVGNRMLTLATRTITGIDVRDSQCGYTAITRKALEILDLHRISDSWGVPNDFLIECACRGLRVKYVQVKARAGLRRSYIRLYSYVPRMVFILLRGTLRIARSRTGHVGMHWPRSRNVVGKSAPESNHSTLDQLDLQSATRISFGGSVGRRARGLL
jgi:glycosyltransferase involved in cell wall biosynthesis